MLYDLTETNAAHHLAFAISYKNDKLKEQILDFVRQLPPEKHLQVFQSAEWREFLIEQFMNEEC
jgi:hypothetical protein